MAKNPHFRLMALTATPGGKPEAVQAIVDALHISHIEIRDEHSLDLKAYIHKKHIMQHIITMNEDVARVRDLLSDAMTVSITTQRLSQSVDNSLDLTADDPEAVEHWCAGSATECCDAASVLV